MPNLHRPIRYLHSLRFWAIWGLLGGLAFQIDGYLNLQPVDTSKDTIGPPAIQPPVSRPATQVTEPPESAHPPGRSATILDWGNKKISMKPVPLEYLKQQLHTVTSHLDLIRIFVDGYVDSPEQLTGRAVRTPRSASLPQQEIQMLKAGLADHATDAEFSEFLMQNLNYMEILKHYGPLDEDYPADEPEPNYEAFESALHHINEMETCSNFRCKDPQPFVHFMKDRERIFFPQCTILHRCMNFTGCCGDSGRECVPKTTTVINKAFIVVNRGHESHVEFNPSMTTVVKLINHTECECKAKPRLPECTKNCPVPFRLMREAYSCTCNCFAKAYEDHIQCEGVKEGVTKLSQAGLVCIKEEHCYPPECVEGTFDVKKGYCPLSDKYSLQPYHFKNPEDRRHFRDHLKYFDFSAANSWSQIYRQNLGTAVRKTRNRHRSSHSKRDRRGKMSKPQLKKTLRQAYKDHRRKVNPHLRDFSNTTRRHHKTASPHTTKNTDERPRPSTNSNVSKALKTAATKTQIRNLNTTHNKNTQSRSKSNYSRSKVHKTVKENHLEKENLYHDAKKETQENGRTESTNKVSKPPKAFSPRHLESGNKTEHRALSPSEIAKRKDLVQSKPSDTMEQRRPQNQTSAQTSQKLQSKTRLQRKLNHDKSTSNKSRSQRRRHMHPENGPELRHHEKDQHFKISPPNQTSLSPSRIPDHPTKGLHRIPPNRLSSSPSTRTPISTLTPAARTVPRFTSISPSQHASITTPRHRDTSKVRHLSALSGQNKSTSASESESKNVPRRRGSSRQYEATLTPQNINTAETQQLDTSNPQKIITSKLQHQESSVVPERDAHERRQTKKPGESSRLPDKGSVGTSTLTKTPTTSAPKSSTGHRTSTKDRPLTELYSDDMPDSDSSEDWIGDSSDDSSFSEGSGEYTESQN